jgi:hypothetical protein
VLTEYLNYFGEQPEVLRRHAAASARRMMAAASIRVISQSRASFLAGLTRYEQRSDKGYSHNPRTTENAFQRGPNLICRAPNDASSATRSQPLLEYFSLHPSEN